MSEQFKVIMIDSISGEKGHVFGKELAVGEDITIQEAANYLKVGVAEPIGEVPQEVKQILNPMSDAEKHARLTLALADLDSENAELFTSDGKPKVDVLQLAVEFEVTAEMRDAVWEEHLQKLEQE